MTVYILIRQDDYRQIIAVFSTRELAKKAAAELPYPYELRITPWRVDDWEFNAA